MGNGLPHASAASFAQIVRYAIQLLFELWLQSYPNRHDKKVLNNLFNSLLVGRCPASFGDSWNALQPVGADCCNFALLWFE